MRNRLNISWKTSFSAEELAKESRKNYRKSQMFALHLGSNPAYLIIVCYLKSQDDKGDHIGIYLKLEKNTEINCSDLIMQVSIVNAHKKVFYSKTKAIMPSNEWNENKFGFPQFISHDMIFSKELKEAIFDNKLHLRVGISKVRGGKECLKVSKVINEIPQSIEDELIMNDDDFMSSFEFEGRGCDVIIRTSDNVELKAHKSILEVHSPVFELRFSIENKKDTFDVYEFNVNVVREFLRFCYYQQIQNASPFIFNLLKMALLYENVNLVTHCIQIINENTSFSNVFELLKESETIECLELTNMIANFIKRNWHKLKHREEWISIDPKLTLKFMDIFIMGC